MGSRKTFNYDLKDGSKIIYQGITQDPSAREEQHRQEGKRFSHMVLYPVLRTPDGARGGSPKHKKASNG